MEDTSLKTWSCPKCTCDNDITRDVCSACHHHYRLEAVRESTDRSPERKRKQKNESTRRRPFRGMLSLFKTREEVSWCCPQCTYINTTNMHVCQACGFSVQHSRDMRDDDDEGAMAASSKIVEGISSLTSTVGQFMKKLASGWSSTQNNPAVDHEEAGWTCPKCTFVNHPDLLHCEQCGSGSYPKPPQHQSHSSLPSDITKELHLLPTENDDMLLVDSTVLSTLISEEDKHEQQSMQWVCPACTAINTISVSKCHVCEHPSPAHVNEPVTSTEMTSLQWQQSRSVKEIQQLQEDHMCALQLDIVEHCKQMQKSFIDPDFPHSNHSLYISPKQPIRQFLVDRWARITVDQTSGQWSLCQDPRPDDIAQGSVGDCWFLSALAVIAEFPELLKQIIVTEKLCPEGVYIVRLCQDGLWKSILVDDFFPVCHGLRLTFSKARRNQLWVPLIEKAMAKMYGSYEALDGGDIISGLSVLTGYPCDRIRLKAEYADSELIWAKLLSFKESKFPMAASSSPASLSESTSYDDVGIQPYHAYSILDIKQIGTESLLLLRDPWGHTNWWKPGHEWMETEPGTFWIGVNDLFRYFSHVDVCYYHPDWHSIRVCGHLLPYAHSHLKIFTLQTFVPTEINLCLYQPSYRGHEDKRQKRVDMQLIVVRYDGNRDVLDETESLPFPSECVLTSDCQAASVITCSTLLNPGRYAVIPLSYKNWHQHEESASQCTSHDSSSHVPYVLALFSSKVIEWLEQVPTKPGFVAESLFLVAKKKGTLKKLSSNVIMYEAVLRPCCYYFMIENQDRYLHVRIQFDVTESVNIRSSRTSLKTDDYIPPNHKQVLMVLSPLLIQDTFHFQYSLQYKYQFVPCNPLGQWGSFMSPILTDTNRELHSPRPIS